MPERKRHKRKLPKVVSRDEAERLLEAAGRGRPEDVGVRNRLALELMYRAGLRVSEVVKLMPRDVQEEGVVRIYDGKGGDGTAYYEPAALLPLLDRWLRIRDGYMFPFAGSTPLICKPNGDPLTVRYIQRLVARLRDECGIIGVVTPHVFRHTFATEALRDFNLREVQRLLRHANIGTTQIYTHVEDDELRRKMAARSDSINLTRKEEE